MAAHQNRSQGQRVRDVLAGLPHHTKLHVRQPRVGREARGGARPRVRQARRPRVRRRRRDIRPSAPQVTARVRIAALRARSSLRYNAPIVL